MHSTLSPDALFSEALPCWLESRTFELPSSSVPVAIAGRVLRHRYLKPRTLTSYAQYGRALSPFFAKLALKDIHLGHFREYQKLRSPHAGPNKITQELGLLIQVLRKSGLWTEEMDAAYQPFAHIESDIPRALSLDEQDLWLKVASSHERFALVYWYSLVALRSCASASEMRGLQLGDFNHASGLLYVREASAKNRHRIRSIPLAEDAVWAMQRLVERARTVGCELPQHHLFPFRLAIGQWAPERHMSDWGIRKPWDEVRQASGLASFRPNDVRHTAVTRYAEAGTPIHVILSLAGHISAKMQQHYVWIGEQAQRMAVQAVSGGSIYGRPERARPHSWTRPGRMTMAAHG